VNASLVAPVPGEDRFARFLWISATLHVALVAAFVAFARFPRSAEPSEVLSFQLVGEPPRGPAGPAASPAPAAAPEVPVEAEAAPPEVETAPSTAVPVAKPQPQLPATRTPPSTKPGTGATSSPTTSLPAGPLAGSPTGDTLSVGGQGGEPTAMNLWLSRVKYQVERNWQAPSGLAGVKAAPEVVFDVARDGRPSRPKLRVKSGSAMLDGLALRAVSSVELFPPVPGSWKPEVVTVRYVLEYAH
jgi:outer membrane biosynthesis protein TonB